ncbi:MAG: LPS export ABC transporter periplasmic protein LptC [Alphaproteobacteria bacterium]
MSALSSGENRKPSPFATVATGFKRFRRRLRRRWRRLRYPRRAEGLRPHARRYRYVRVLKLLLPAIAAALVVLVAFWPQLRDRTGEFRLHFTSLGSQEAETVQMINPRFLGIDALDRHYTITAGRATQLDDSRVNLENPKGDMTLEDGTWIALSANTGIYHKEQQVLDLAGGVNLYHDSGYEFHTEQASIDFQQGTAAGDTATTGQGPIGHIEAEGFRVFDRGDRVLFTGKARLVLYGDEQVSGQ